MEIIKFNDFYQNPKYNQYRLNIAVGEFDGVHIAHQELLKQTVLLTTNNNERSCCLTFEPHPHFIFKPDLTNYLLNSFEDKAKHIRKQNIDYLIIIDFDLNFSKISKGDFINNYLLKLNIKNIICGDDFSFGYLGEGKPSDLLTYSNYFNTQIVSLKKKDNEIISSSLIRDNLLHGLIKKSNLLLGYHYSLKGIVIHGKEVGRSLGFPTANIKINKEYLIPKLGVYAVKCFFDNCEYLGILNIGHNPTCNYQSESSIEVNVINYCGDLYHKTIEIAFLDYLRAEIKFNSVNELINQLNTDKKFVLDNFK